MKQKYTQARKEGNRRWDAANLDRISIAFPKGQRETIKAAATAVDESVSTYIRRSVYERMERDGLTRGGIDHPVPGAGNSSD